MDVDRKQNRDKNEPAERAKSPDRPHGGHGRPNLHEKEARGGHRVWRQQKQLLQNMDIDDLRDYLLETEM